MELQRLLVELDQVMSFANVRQYHIKEKYRFLLNYETENIYIRFFNSKSIKHLSNQ